MSETQKLIEEVRAAAAIVKWREYELRQAIERAELLALKMLAQRMVTRDKDVR